MVEHSCSCVAVFLPFAEEFVLYCIGFDLLLYAEVWVVEVARPPYRWVTKGFLLLFVYLFVLDDVVRDVSA